MSITQTHQFQPSTNPVPLAPARAEGSVRLADGTAIRSRLGLRLIIALPVLLVLMTVCYGLVSYLAFSSNWEALERLGAAEIAGSLLEIHLATMLILTLVGIVSGIALAWAILRPVQSLVKTVRLVAAGQLDLRAPAVNAAPELEALSDSFNEMIDRLDASFSERYRLLVEGIPIGVLTTDLQGHMTAASPVACHCLGLPADRLIGRRVADLTEIDHPEGRELIERIARTLEEHTSDPEPTNPKSTDRKSEIRNPKSNASTFHIPHSAFSNLTPSPLRDARGRVTGLVFSFRQPDVVRNLSDHLKRTDQLASLGAFALGLAHQVRNPLCAVKGFGQLLLLECDLPERAVDYAGRMIGEIDRIDRFVGRLLRLSDQPVAAPEPADLRDVLADALEYTRRELTPTQAKTVVRRDDRSAPPILMLERERVTHAVAQILKNAYHFTPAGGTIALACGVDSDRAPDGERGAFLRIHNTGSSLDPTVRPRVFEPFFTTTDHATGLGLTFAREIIAQNGGSLEVETDASGVAFVARFDPARAVESPAAGGCAGAERDGASRP
jgi:signal transduction histidine kinase